MPDMNLIRKHLMIEGQIEKECLVKILNEVTDIYRKCFLRKGSPKEQSLKGCSTRRRQQNLFEIL